MIDYYTTTTLDSVADILFKNFFDSKSNFATIATQKIPHPVNVFQNEEGLCFEIACTGIDKSEITVEVDSTTLRVKYQKSLKDTMSESAPQKVFSNSLSQKSFDLGWRISDVYDLSKLEAKQFEGLLTITIPNKQKTVVRKIEIQ
jgi:HSP20 family molecular chaperone IbpA